MMEKFNLDLNAGNLFQQINTILKSLSEENVSQINTTLKSLSEENVSNKSTESKNNVKTQSKPHPLTEEENEQYWDVFFDLLRNAAGIKDESKKCSGCCDGCSSCECTNSAKDCSGCKKTQNAANTKNVKSTPKEDLVIASVYDPWEQFNSNDSVELKTPSSQKSSSGSLINAIKNAIKGSTDYSENFTSNLVAEIVKSKIEKCIETESFIFDKTEPKNDYTKKSDKITFTIYVDLNDVLDTLSKEYTEQNIKVDSQKIIDDLQNIYTSLECANYVNSIIVERFPEIIDSHVLYIDSIDSLAFYFSVRLS